MLQSKVLLLSTTILLATTCLAAEQRIEPGVGVDAFSLPDAFDLADQAQGTASVMEELLALPHGHLRPAYVYNPEDQAGQVTAHFRNPNTRFMEVERGGRDEAAIYASPWIVRRPHEQGDQQGVLFFEIDRRGRVSPTIHAGFREGVLSNYGENFWHFLNRHATRSYSHLVHEHGPLHLVAL